MSSMRLSEQNLPQVDAYFEYRNIVGDTDNSTLLSQQEYDALRERAAEASKDPLRVFWRNTINGLDCRCLGPSSSCLCGHRLRDHDWLARDTKQVKCRMNNCKCPLFDFIPVHGSQDIKCRCHHSYVDHDIVSRKCLRCATQKAPPSSRSRAPASSHAKNASCLGFTSSYTCSCGSSAAAHETVFETESERRARGEVDIVGPLGPDGGSLSFTGGLSDFTSLLDGVDRMSVYCEDPLARLRDQHARAANAAPGTNASLVSRNRERNDSKGPSAGSELTNSDNVMHLLYKPCSFKAPLRRERA
ncbi:hypothetical protein BESB_067610 [Besnoitia besnoiti]|uniref:Protein FAM221A n=1 Tax=Besnoitia besnoiti TaxID=94643 RepID=A0A2A9M8B6_BESBE|nr:hypothetical protein BESB_067610 [Besnoitia besnoiti]PFH34728.1 hypothetical protein BESB_067610 [Besnoitia besnoiti]